MHLLIRTAPSSQSPSGVRLDSGLFKRSDERGTDASIPCYQDRAQSGPGERDPIDPSEGQGPYSWGFIPLSR